MRSSTRRKATYKLLADYYTPDILADALVAVLPFRAGGHVLEPHVGGGAFVHALLAQDGVTVEGMDISPHAPGLALLADRAMPGDYLESSTRCEVGDFLTTPPLWRPDWIIGNPPYGPGRGVAEAHIRRALNVVAPGGSVAFLLRLAILESSERAAFWRQHPARKIWVLAERPSFTEGGTDSAAYGWFWWDLAYSGPTTLEVLSWKSSPGGPQVDPDHETQLSRHVVEGGE